MLEHINATLTLYARGGAQLAVIEFSDVGEAVVGEYARGILTGAIGFPVRANYVLCTGQTEEHGLGRLTPWWMDATSATRNSICYGPMPFEVGEAKAGMI